VNIDGLKRLWKTAFDDPDSAIDSFFAVAYSPQRCRYLEEDGKIVSALYWFDCEYDGGKLAYIYAVATDPVYRGISLASHLLEKTHAHLKELGYAGAVLKPAKGLFPFYARLGYITSGFLRRFAAKAGPVPASLKPLTAAQYAAMRRKFLPENAIIQEGATLEYLQTFACFYAAEGALICVAREEPVILEYLGDLQAAPAVLAALGIPEAQLPTPGNDVPFVMYFPLNCTKMPGYLGITLE